MPAHLTRLRKAYEVHHVPLKQRVFSDINTQDICKFETHSDFRQKYVYIEKDIFGVKTHDD